VRCNAPMGRKRYHGSLISGAVVGAEKGRSQRRLRVGEELRHAVSTILQQGVCRDPVLRNASIAVTEVRLSADLRNATVFVMPLGGANAREVVTGLQHSSAFLRRLVARNVTLRYAPNLMFALDGSFDQAERIAALLARPDVARDLQSAVSSESLDDAG
jgi:ribosome-binding factor A